MFYSKVLFWVWIQTYHNYCTDNTDFKFHVKLRVRLQVQVYAHGFCLRFCGSHQAELNRKQNSNAAKGSGGCGLTAQFLTEFS